MTKARFLTKEQMLIGDGYVIAERIGMTIQRRNDSDSGNNQVQFHICRRLDEHIELASGVLAQLEENDHQANLD